MKKLIAILALAATIPAQAAFLSGNKLLEYMNIENGYSGGLGDGFVSGVSDTLDGVAVCANQNVTFGQHRAVVLQYLNKNPRKLHYNAAVLVYEALKEAFPCKK